jgi:hypothetical protein
LCSWCGERTAIKYEKRKLHTGIEKEELSTEFDINSSLTPHWEQLYESNKEILQTCTNGLLLTIFIFLFINLWMRIGITELQLQTL